jgi:tRNA threonylcarbamoyladenosine biosynthesis protein TsaB
MGKNMLILGLDTSTPATSVALWEDGTLLAETLVNQGLSHSEQLVGLVKQLLKTTGLSLSQVDVYACTKGPGSFTGLRIGVAATKGFAQYHQKPIIGISLLELTAWNMAGAVGWICPMVDAQRDQVYAGVYTWQNDRIQPVREDKVMSITDFMEEIVESDQPAVCLGSGTGKISGMDALSQRIDVLPGIFGMPRAAMLCQAAFWKWSEEEAMSTWMDFEPDYFRKSQAEIQMDLRKGGMS